MIRRKRIVQARLTFEEAEKFEPLIKQRHLWNWSELIRSALQRYWLSCQPVASDNGVIHTNGETKTPASKSPAKKKPTRRDPSRRGKSKVSH